MNPSTASADVRKHLTDVARFVKIILKASPQKKSLWKPISFSRASPVLHFGTWCLSSPAKEPQRFKHIWLNNYIQPWKELKTFRSVRRGGRRLRRCYPKHALAPGFVVLLRLAGNEVIRTRVDYRAQSKKRKKQPQRQGKEKKTSLNGS